MYKLFPTKCCGKLKRNYINRNNICLSKVFSHTKHLQVMIQETFLAFLFYFENPKYGERYSTRHYFQYFLLHQILDLAALGSLCDSEFFLLITAPLGHILASLVPKFPEALASGIRLNT